MVAPRRWCNHVPTMLASLDRMNSTPGMALALASVAILAGCDRTSPPTGGHAGGKRPASNETAYHPAPAVDGVGREAGRIVITGRAQPAARVRLATPEGRVVSVTASSVGRWRIDLAPSPELRLFSLSTLDGGRIVQSEGYLGVAPNLAAQLRAGAGALVYGAIADAPRILAVDYDSKGGCVVSGVAAAGHAIALDIDGAERGKTRAGSAGRFSLALDEPVAFGPHTIDVVDGDRRASVQIAMTAAGPMPPIPLRATQLGPDWRVDWTTPGGGLQTSLLFPPPEPASGDAA